MDAQPTTWQRLDVCVELCFLEKFNFCEAVVLLQVLLPLSTVPQLCIRGAVLTPLPLFVARLSCELLGPALPLSTESTLRCPGPPCKKSHILETKINR